VIGRRRALLAVAGFISSPLYAQPARRVARIGYLTGGSAESDARLFGAFRRGLRELGYAEGDNIAIEARFAAGDFARLQGLANDLVRSAVNVIVAGGELEASAAKAASSTLPIVMHSPDALSSGLVASLARPGGNVTGMSDVHGELITKRLEILREVIPDARRFAVMFNPLSPSHAGAVKILRASAATAGLELLTLEMQQASDIERCLAAIASERPVGVIVVADKVIGGQAHKIGSAAAGWRIATIGTHRGFVEDRGFLLAYGTDLDALYRRLAVYVDRILKGANPSELPVEQPTKFELTISLRAARRTGIAIPPGLLARADEVIE
jgi:putative tryptophan/tyrosine transport system substrate-binding protein